MVLDDYYTHDNIHDIGIIPYRYQQFVVPHFRYICHYRLSLRIPDIGTARRNAHVIRQFGASFGGDVSGGVLHVLRDCS